MRGTSSVSSTVELFLDLVLSGIGGGCECNALARLSEAVDFIACSLVPDVGGAVDGIVDGSVDGFGDGLD